MSLACSSPLAWGVVKSSVLLMGNSMAGRVDGKVAIVTGAASGLGAADARLLVEEGATVIATDINVEAGEALAAEIGEEFVAHDVADEASWQSLIPGVVQRHGKLDVLVNNAGNAIIADIESTTTEQWRTKSIAVHGREQKYGIRCNSIHPGAISTPDGGRQWRHRHLNCEALRPDQPMSSSSSW